MNNAESKHFSQKRLRKAEFIKPPNILKQKVGSGGLDEDILEKAEDMIEYNDVDFVPLAESYLETLSVAIDLVKKHDPDADEEELIDALLFPTMQLKGNGGMFHYDLVSKISDRIVQFLEVIARPDEDTVEIMLAFHKTIRAIIKARMSGEGGKQGAALYDELDSVCMRYFKAYPENCEF